MRERETEALEKDRAFEDLTHRISEMEAALTKARADLEMLSHAVIGGTARLAVEDDLRIIAASEGYYKMIGYSEEESAKGPVHSRGINLVLPQDRAAVAQILRQLLTANKAASVSYRIRKKDGSIAWNTAYCSGILEIDGEKVIDVFFADTTEPHNTQAALQSLLDNIPAGVVRASVADDITIEYANQEFYHQIGYTPAEFDSGEIARRYLRIVHPADRADVLAKARRYVETERDCMSLRYRILTKQGEKRWILAKASRLTGFTDPDMAMQVILTDITEEQKQKKAIALNEECYRIISEQTRDTVFEWDIVHDQIRFSPMYEKMFGFRPPENVSIANLTEFDIIYEADKPQVQRMIRQILSGVPHAAAEYRAKCADGSYLWCRNQTTTIFDDENKPVHVIGLLTDINDLKRENASLQEQASRDSMTNLLNRMAMQEQVERRLLCKPDRQYAFLLLDIDRFKLINDQFGHVTGDAVLRWVAAYLTEHFRENDLIGRLGGDEFCVFLTGIASEQAIQEKMRRLVQAIRKASQFDQTIPPVSVSLGVAFYPGDSRAFLELYQHADAALYQVKRAGGNGAAFYGRD